MTRTKHKHRQQQARPYNQGNYQHNNSGNFSQSPQNTRNFPPVSAIARSYQPSIDLRSPEQIAFEIEFSQWEKSFDDWKRAYAFHPDREAYYQYEKKFLDVREKLMAKRMQIYTTKLSTTSQLDNQLNAATMMAESILQKFSDSPGPNVINQSMTPSVNIYRSNRGCNSRFDTYDNFDGSYNSNNQQFRGSNQRYSDDIFRPVRSIIDNQRSFDSSSPQLQRNNANDLRQYNNQRSFDSSSPQVQRNNANDLRQYNNQRSFDSSSPQVQRNNKRSFDSSSPQVQRNNANDLRQRSNKRSFDSSSPQVQRSNTSNTTNLPQYKPEDRGRNRQKKVKVETNKPASSANILQRKKAEVPLGTIRKELARKDVYPNVKWVPTTDEKKPDRVGKRRKVKNAKILKILAMKMKEGILTIDGDMLVCPKRPSAAKRRKFALLSSKPTEALSQEEKSLMAEVEANRLARKRFFLARRQKAFGEGKQEGAEKSGTARTQSGPQEATEPACVATTIEKVEPTPESSAMQVDKEREPSLKVEEAAATP